jgi:glutathione S-transferase
MMSCGGTLFRRPRARRMLRAMDPIKLYRHPLSGHAHRVELLLSLLGLPFSLVEVDISKGAHKQPDFLAKNAFGQLPVIEDGSVTLADSNAILVYLALKYDKSQQYLPREPVAAAEVQRWLSVAAGELRYGPGNLRLAALLKAPIDKGVAERACQALLPLVEGTLTKRNWLAGEHLTIADVAMYTYSALAPEGGVSLAPYPAMRAWHARIEALPAFVPMFRASQLSA